MSNTAVGRVVKNMLDTAPATNYIPRPTGYGSSLDPTPSGSRISRSAAGSSKDGGIIPHGSGTRWHVIAAISQQEHRALFELLNQGFDAYLPMHLDCVRQRIVPLFRGYVFAAFDAGSDPWGKILSTRGVWSLLRNTAGLPAPLPIGCVEDLIARTSERRIVDDPGVGATLPSRIPLGASCEVIEGPMAGWRGVATLSTEKRVKLLLAMFGGDREVEFKASAVRTA